MVGGTEHNINLAIMYVNMLCLVIAVVYTELTTCNVLDKIILASLTNN